MRYSHIAFDLDNTLLTTDADMHRYFDSYVSALRLEPAKEIAASFFAWNIHCWQKLDEQQINHQELGRLRFQLWAEQWGLQIDPDEANRKYREALGNATTALPGAGALLHRLQGQARLYVASNGFKEQVHKRLNKLGWESFFDSIFASSAMKSGKPHEAFFREVWEAMGAPPKERVLFIGDNYINDIEGARRFGFDTAWIRQREEPGRTATIEVQTLPELEKILFTK